MQIRVIAAVITIFSFIRSLRIYKHSVNTCEMKTTSKMAKTKLSKSTAKVPYINWKKRDRHFNHAFKVPTSWLGQLLAYQKFWTAFGVCIQKVCHYFTTVYRLNKLCVFFIHLCTFYVYGSFACVSAQVEHGLIRMQSSRV